jgi:deazaflavin-dependent oxidoreductase (nitroreductase family)
MAEAPAPGSQRVEQVWETPSLEEIPKLSASHVEAMESDDLPPDVAEMVWKQAGMDHVLLRTVGRKSGNEHKVALPIWRDPEGRRVVVASFAGAPGDPSWYLNLSDRDANPEVWCKAQDGAFWSSPEVLDGDEYDRIWGLLTADRAWYDTYQGKTERRIPLVRLPETRPA